MSLPWYEVLWISTRTEIILFTLKLPLSYILIRQVTAVVENQGKLLKRLGCIAGAYIMATVIDVVYVFYIFYPKIYKLPIPENDTLSSRGLSSFLDLLFASGVFFAVFQYFQHQKWKLRERELINARMLAELRLIKSQTNPHFLFNTLNTLYALSRKQSPHTPEGLMKLSNLLRFLLYEASENVITISRELSIIQDYIELEKLRWGEKVNINLSIDIDTEHEEIIPTILLQLVENAFKHGTEESRFNSYIFIQVKLEDSFLRFKMRNSAEAEKPHSEVGMGLKNFKRLIDLSYSNYHFLSELKNNEFLVELNIALNDRK